MKLSYLNTLKILLGAAIVSGCVFTATFATAQEKSAAVEKPNFDLSVGGGVLDENSQAFISGTASLPVSHSYGVQFDGSLASGEGDDRGGVAGHFFYRDPASHLIGGTVMWGRVGDYDVMRIGPEAEFYMGDASFYINGGWQDEDNGSTGYGMAEANYYVTDNFVVGANANAFSDVRGGGFDAEWQPEGSSFSVFSEVGDDNKSAGYVLAGVRMSFGTDNASLKERHRHYDPPNIVQTFTVRDSGPIAAAAASSPAPTPACVPIPPYCTCLPDGTLMCL